MSNRENIQDGRTAKDATKKIRKHMGSRSNEEFSRKISEDELSILERETKPNFFQRLRKLK